MDLSLRPVAIHPRLAWLGLGTPCVALSSASALVHVVISGAAAACSRMLSWQVSYTANSLLKTHVEPANKAIGEAPGQASLLSYIRHTDILGACMLCDALFVN
jgi:hypothetical protein